MRRARAQTMKPIATITTTATAAPDKIWAPDEGGMLEVITKSCSSSPGLGGSLPLSGKWTPCQRRVTVDPSLFQNQSETLSGLESTRSERTPNISAAVWL